MWQNILGHDAVAERFRRSLACGRLASTYLLVGPDGIGKRSFALQLAKVLLCTESDDASLAPCGQCDSCRLFDAGTHPDLDQVGRPAGKRSLPVDLFLGDREHRNKEGLCHNISLRPMIGRRRIAIIDDADWFTPESANCLLKTLEEPPPGAVIFLIGTSRSRQLPTILSRSQIVRFHSLPEQTVSELLISQQLVEDPQAADQLAQASEGSLSRAVELADPDAWNLRERLSQHFARPQLEVARVAADLTEAINSAGKEAESRRRRFRQCLHAAVEVFSQRMHQGASESNKSEARVALAAIDRSLLAEEQLARNANQATLLESWLSDLAHLHKASA